MSTPTTEELSPFVEWRAEEDGVVPDTLVGDDREDSVLVALLRSPSVIVRKLRDPREVIPLTTTAMVALMLSAALFAIVAARNESLWVIARGALGAALAFLTATGAAITPIYGVSMLLQARLPLTRLAACLAAAGATGALVLAAQAPLVLTFLKLDAAWAGPMSVVAAYAIAGLIGGARLYRMLVELATSTIGRPSLTQSELFRVGILARVSMMILGLTLSLALWSFNVLGTR